jgi:Ni2+-binding GTPase involved in maturation of urease and hydrogenase
VNYTEALSIVSVDKSPLLSNTLSDMINSMVRGGEKSLHLQSVMQALGFDVQGLTNTEETPIPIALHALCSGDIIMSKGRGGLYLGNGTALLDGSVVNIEDLEMVEFYRIAGDSTPSAPDPFLSAMGITDPRSYSPTDTWDRNKTSKLTVPIGENYGIFGKDIPTAQVTPHVINFHETPHIGVVGACGSGKSVLIRNIVIGLAAPYSPDDVEVLYLDKFPNNLARLPHVTVEYGGKGAEKVHRRVLEELDKRRERETHPALFVVLDETHQIASEFTDTIKKTCAIGRALNIHVVYAAQRITAVDAGIRANLGSIYRVGTAHNIAQELKITGYPYGTNLSSNRGFAVCTTHSPYGVTLSDSVQVFDTSQNADAELVVSRISALKTAPTWLDEVRKPTADGTMSLEVPFGVSPYKTVVPLNLSGTNDGAHVSLHGTYGSGKTVAYTNIVAGLSHKHTPDNVRFVLLDPSGAHSVSRAGRVSPMGLLSEIPHVEAHAYGDEVSRVMDALRKELLRREEGSRSSKDFVPTPETPHLVVVFDAGDTPVAQLPEDQFTSLKLIAGLGRRLGIHLVVASVKDDDVLGVLGGSGTCVNLETAGKGTVRRVDSATSERVHVYNPNMDGALTEVIAHVKGSAAGRTAFTNILERELS